MSEYECFNIKLYTAAQDIFTALLIVRKLIIY